EKSSLFHQFESEVDQIQSLDCCSWEPSHPKPPKYADEKKKEIRYPLWQTLMEQPKEKEGLLQLGTQARPSLGITFHMLGFT
ncbi:hypothetical protein DVA81_19410, partial [Acinetobacter baumannii]